MNPNSGEGAPQPSFELPPQQTQENQPTSGELKSDKALERSNPSESAAGRQQPPPAQPAQDQALPASQTQVGDDTSVQPTAHQISNDQAKDSDVIEKVWIDKAKSIIAQTRDDPFVQKSEMSRVKADYIQKRYNKTIPVDDKPA